MLPVLMAVALAGPFVRYQVVESVSASTPHGEQSVGVTGSIAGAAGLARFEVAGGAFPRSTARVAIAEKGGVTLLDTEGRLYAGTDAPGFAALFQPAPGPDTGGSFTPEAVSVEVTPEGPGQPFGAAPTERYRVKGTFRIALRTPGRAGSVITELSGILVAASGLAPTPFDDPLRLVPLRGAARDELARALGRVAGLVVKLDLTLESEVRSVAVAGLPGTQEQRPAKPPRTVVRVERELSAPERRDAREADRALFAVPDGYHARSLDRLAPAAAAP